jgi:hypothetical protein
MHRAALPVQAEVGHPGRELVHRRPLGVRDRHELQDVEAVLPGDGATHTFQVVVGDPVPVALVPDLLLGAAVEADICGYLPRIGVPQNPPLAPDILRYC